MAQTQMQCRMCIVDLEWDNICACNFFVSVLKFINFLLNRVRIVFDEVCFRFSISRSVPKIFVVRIESCAKLCKLLKFLPSKIFGVLSPKNLYISDQLIMPTLWHVTWQSFMVLLLLHPNL